MTKKAKKPVKLPKGYKPSEDEKFMNAKQQEYFRQKPNQIDKALRRIENGTYGYCKETGDPIRLERLDARPIAKLSIEAQEMHERSERLQA